MAKPKDALSAAEYSNYRNIRAVAYLFVVMGAIFVLAGLGSLAQPAPSNPPPAGVSAPAPPEFAAFLAVIGAFGVVGGIATLRGSPKVAPLIYVMAVPYLLAFPIGTILSVVLF